MKNIAIMGFGFIGSGVADVLLENENVICKKIGETINIKYLLDIKNLDGHPMSGKLVRDINIILNDPEIDLIVEALVGVSPAYEYSKAALERGISVVTPNKAVVAKHGAELLEIAAKNDARYFFEASVGGGIPVIRPMYNCLAANKFDKITGILNATTNFILTKMASENLSFDEALKIAQDLGYAERDPSSDVDGLDTGRKICILSALAFGRHLPPEKVHTEGITAITLEDIKNAEKIGCKIKLIAKSEKVEPSGDLYVIAAPMLVDKTSPLYAIEGVFNGIVVTGNVSGDVMFYGSGAGKLTTASAIMADVIDALMRSTKNICWENSDGSFIREYDNFAYYVRAALNGKDLNAAFEAIKSVFPDADIHEANSRDEIFFTTKTTELDEKTKTLDATGLKTKSTLRIL